MNNFITLSYKAHAFEHTTKTTPSPNTETHAVLLRPSWLNCHRRHRVCAYTIQPLQYNKFIYKSVLVYFYLIVVQDRPEQQNGWIDTFDVNECIWLCKISRYLRKEV